LFSLHICANSIHFSLNLVYNCSELTGELFDDLPRAAVVRNIRQTAHRNWRILMYHTIIIVGNLGRDPEMRYTPSGQAVTNFSVATNRQYTSGDGQSVKETIWFRISAWGRTGEVCNEYLRKGSRVLIEGRLVPDASTGGPRIWQRQDGSSAASFEVTAGTVRFLSTRTEDEGAAFATGDQAGQPADEDIPF
jgi:single-strand DNA-binding protein